MKLLFSKKSLGVYGLLLGGIAGTSVTCGINDPSCIAATKSLSTPERDNYIKNEGCWCAGYTGGDDKPDQGLPVSELDTLCRQYAQCKTCATKSAACASGKPTNFLMEYNSVSGLANCNVYGDECERQFCICNAKFIANVDEWNTENWATRTTDKQNYASCNRSPNRGTPVVKPTAPDHCPSALADDDATIFDTTIPSDAGASETVIDGTTWHLIMKGDAAAEAGNAPVRKTFTYHSRHWTTASTLNDEDRTRDAGWAKYGAFNTYKFRKIAAVFPSGAQTIIWEQTASDLITPLELFQTTQVIEDKPRKIKKLPIWDATIWSSQQKTGEYGFNLDHSTGTNNFQVRWGFIFNNEEDFSSVDAMGGIGVSYETNAEKRRDYKTSSGDIFWCCGTERTSSDKKFANYQYEIWVQ